jgi:hypothetical protein
MFFLTLSRKTTALSKLEVVTVFWLTTTSLDQVFFEPRLNLSAMRSQGIQSDPVLSWKFFLVAAGSQRPVAMLALE